MRRMAFGYLLALLAACAPPEAPPPPLPAVAEISPGLTVTPTNLGGWTIQLTGTTATAQFSLGPAGPPAGRGSIELTTGADGDGGPQLRNAGYAGHPLGQLTALSYYTHITANFNCQAPYLVLSVDNNGDGKADDHLFFEPCYQTGTYIGEPVPNQGNVQLGVWQHWDALVGGWWPESGGTPGPPLVTIASYLRDHPGATIVNDDGGKGGVRLAAGFGAPVWDNFIGHADALTIGLGGSSTFYDFEPRKLCQPKGPPLIDVSQHVKNDIDSGVAGNFWAYDAYRKTIQVRAGDPGTFCAVVTYAGSFVTVAGKSPGGKGTINAGITGALDGLYGATIQGDLNPAPGYPTNGDLGTFDFQCDAATGKCPGLFDWVKVYFNPGADFSFDDWAWIYLAGKHGAWLNSSAGNAGDIHN